MLSPLEQSILSTLVYFDMFEYPLTLLELHRFLRGSAYTVHEVSEALRTSEPLGRLVRFQDGFFYLRTRAQVLRRRQERFIFAIEKYKRAQRISRLLSYIPFVRLVAVCNSLAYSNARLESDIDLFVITKSDGVWWARFFSLLLLKLLHLRPGQNNRQDKICLSFFIDEAHLDVSQLQIGGNDIYLSYWLATLYPLYDTGNYYERLLAVNHIKQAGPTHPLRTVAHRTTVRYLAEWLLAPFTFAARAFQVSLLPPAVRELVGQDTRVRVESGVLKFHTNDRREQYAGEFAKRYAAVVSLALAHA